MNPVKNDLIYFITQGKTTDQNCAEKRVSVLDLIKVAVETKIPLVQIREKQLSARNVFELASEAAKIAKNSDTKILVNDRADIAIAAKADGVHLTANSISVREIRRSFPKNLIVGASVHSLEEADDAKRFGADFAVFGPVFQTPGKGVPKGVNALHEICERLKPFPIIGIGGVDESNYREILRIANGFAAIRFLNSAENLRKLRQDE